MRTQAAALTSEAAVDADPADADPVDAEAEELDPTVPGPEVSTGGELTLSGAGLRVSESSALLTGGEAPLALVTTATEVAAQATGWFDQTGQHKSDNPNYIAGRYNNTRYNSFFVFDLGGLSGEVSRVTLTLPNPRTAGSPQGYTLYKVTTLPGELTKSQSPRSDPGLQIFGDLEEGTKYVDAATLAPPAPAPLVLELNQAGRDAVQAALAAADKRLALGGALNTGAGTADVYLFGRSGNGNPNAGSLGEKSGVVLTVYFARAADVTAPVLSLPQNITEEAAGPAGAVVSYSATATDAEDGAVTPSCTPASGGTFALGTTPVTCTATDAAGNRGTGSFTVTVRDTTAPRVNHPSSFSQEATGPQGAPVTFGATASDSVDGSLDVTCTPPSGSTFALGTTTVSCTARDAAGNAATETFQLRVQDTTAPALVLPTPAPTEATGPQGAAVRYTASASDLVDGTVAVACSPASGAPFALGTTTVRCTATDNAGNTASGTFGVEVVDTTPPQLSVPENLTAEATGPNGAAVGFTSAAEDLVDGPIPPTCTPASGSTFALGTTAVTCAATDRAGNTASAAFSVEVRDTTPPALSDVPASTVAEATGPAGAAVTWTDPTAFDLVDGPVGVHCSPGSGSTFALGTTQVICSAEDRLGHRASAAFTVTVQDTTAPLLTVPEPLTATATSAQGSVVLYSASASDIVDGSVSVTCTPASGSLFAPGSTSVSCSATDAHGNTGRKSFLVTVSFSWSGFLQPINMTGSSVFKLGSTVPVKFQLTGASAGIANLGARLYIAKLDNAVVGTELEVQSTSAADTGNTFRYSATDAQYIFNLATKGLTAGTWQLRADLGDGVDHTVVLSLKK